MKSIITSALLVSAALGSAVPRDGPKVDYTGFKALRVTLPENAGNVQDKLETLVAHVLTPGKKELDVVVAPKDIDAVKKLVASSKVINEDVGAALKEEGSFSAAAVPSESWFTAYHTYAQNVQFLRDLQAGYPSNSEVVTAGTSFQGRTLTGIRIWGSGGKGTKPVVLIHATVHAREWITTTAAEYFAWQLLTKYGSDAAIKAVVDKFEFVIDTVVNPDGYVYSQTTDRLWRKNRKTISGQSCVGTDINRNWPQFWSNTGGASTSPCSETYKGQAAGDTSENKGLVAQLQQLKASQGIRLYLDIHSYGQYILSPYGYDCNARPENNAAHLSLAQRAASAIQAVSGTAYTYGPSCSTLYKTTGSSTDYTDITGNATYSFTYELRDKGANGFTLPASQIQPTVRETWAGVLSMFQNI